MQTLLWLLRWILKVAIFFTLFAFALNNQHTVTAHFFFGNAWSTPLILLVLIAFTAGVAVGVLGMVPRWWNRRSQSQRERPSPWSTENSGVGGSVVQASRDNSNHGI